MFGFNTKTEVKIVLNEEDFRCLVRGGELTLTYPKEKAEVRIILQDIGIHAMFDGVNRARSGIDLYKGLSRPG